MANRKRYVELSLSSDTADGDAAVAKAKCAKDNPDGSDTQHDYEEEKDSDSLPAAWCEFCGYIAEGTLEQHEVTAEHIAHYLSHCDAGMTYGWDWCVGEGQRQAREIQEKTSRQAVQASPSRIADSMGQTEARVLFAGESV